MSLFSKNDRHPVPVCKIGLPEHRDLYGDGNWGGDTYYADYAGIADKYDANNILEMGVFLGYSAVAMLHGDSRRKYRGIDAELEIDGSNSLAEANIRTALGARDVAIFNVNVLTENLLLPSAIVLDGPYDLVNVDACHTDEGTLRQLQLAWPLVAPGGVVVVDDVLVNTEVATGTCGFVRWLGDQEESVEMQIYSSNIRGWVIFRKRP